MLNSYMSSLNTDPVLWRALDDTMATTQAQSDAAREAGWTREELKAGASLLLEFEQAGMRADNAAAGKYRQQMDQEQALCAQLVRFEVCHATVVSALGIMYKAGLGNQCSNANALSCMRHAREPIAFRLERVKQFYAD